MNAPSAEKVKVVKQVSRPEIVFAAARKPGTGLVFFGGSDFQVHVMDLEQDKPTAKDFGGHESYVTGLALAGSYLISGGYDGRLIWWDVESGSKVRDLNAHGKWIRHVAATPDQQVVASVADDMVCRLWDVASGRLLHELRGHEEMTPHHFSSMLFACAISPDGRQIATGDKVGHINIWAIDSGDRLAEVEAPTFYTWDPVQRRHSIGGIRALAFSPDGTRLAVGGISKIGNIDHLDSKPRIEVFDWRKGQRLGEVQGEGRGLVERLEFHPGGDWLLGAGGYTDGFLLFCDADGKKVHAQAKAPMYVHDLALNEGYDRVYAVGHHKIAVLQLEK
jgi:WD40 repeat protein